MRKESTTVLLDQQDRDKLKRLMAEWHLSLSGAVRKLIQDRAEGIALATLALEPVAAPPELEPVFKKQHITMPSEWNEQ